MAASELLIYRIHKQDFEEIYVLEFQFWLKVILLNMINIEYVDNSHDSNLKKTVSRISKAFKQTRQTNLVHDRR